MTRRQGAFERDNSLKANQTGLEKPKAKEHENGRGEEIERKSWKSGASAPR
jgi:hypothetical protein